MTECLDCKLPKELTPDMLINKYTEPLAIFAFSQPTIMETISKWFHNDCEITPCDVCGDDILKIYSSLSYIGFNCNVCHKRVWAHSHCKMTVHGAVYFCICCECTKEKSLEVI